MSTSTTRRPGLDAMLSAALDATTDLLHAPCYELRADFDDEKIIGHLHDLGPGRLVVHCPFGPRGCTREIGARLLAQCVMDRRIKVPDEIAARIERGEIVRWM